ncbi:MAG: hypothetical protein EOO04_13675 [Chitinophagaceae bacterium]|nr:MAG: hypothetical protein EOO04_13675 [Chitinophagaceae bacterium]
MENDKLLSGEQGLEIIRSMINKAKNQFGDNGHLYLMWGWVVLLCSLTEFFLLNYTRWPYHYSVWFATWVAAIYSFYYSYKNKQKKAVKTYTDEIISYVWIVFVIMMLMFAFIFGAILGKDYYVLINPGFLALYGMPTFLSGIILKFRPLIAGAIVCWLLSMFSAFVDPRYHLLCLAAGVVSAWIIPGYLMRSNYKNQVKH